MLNTACVSVVFLVLLFAGGVVDALQSQAAPPCPTDPTTCKMTQTTDAATCKDPKTGACWCSRMSYVRGVVVVIAVLVCVGVCVCVCVCMFVCVCECV